MVDEKATTGELIKAPSKAVQSAITKANTEHAKANDGARATIAAKNYALTHAIACGKALLAVKEKTPYGEFRSLFTDPDVRFESDKNRTFDFNKTQAACYLKIAKYPALARAAASEDDAERFSLDRTYAALSSATPEAEQSAKTEHRIKGTGKNEWYTPQEYIEAAREVLGCIDLDPASSVMANQTVGAKKIFTIDDNGLEQEWRNTVWMNPPYSQPDIRLFADKLVAEYQSGRVTAAIALTHNYTDTAWFHAMLDGCSAVCVTKGRIRFINEDGDRASPTQGQAFFYFGEDARKFHAVFSAFGHVLVDHQGEGNEDEL